MRLLRLAGNAYTSDNMPTVHIPVDELGINRPEAMLVTILGLYYLASKEVVANALEERARNEKTSGKTNWPTAYLSTDQCVLVPPAVASILLEEESFCHQQ